MTYQSSIIRVYGATDFITGLRAFAATMVVVMHTGAFAGFGPLGEAITSAGKYGVDVFFVISGFTIAKTFTAAPSYRAYFLRRIFRIVPLYWAAIIIGLLMARSGIEVSYWMADLDASTDMYNLLLHLAMVSYLDFRVANSVLGVEWTIPIEVFWYAFLPLLLHRVQTVLRTFGAVLILAVLTGVMAYISKKTLGTSLAIKWSPVASGHWFFIGALTYFLREKLDNDRGPRLARVASGAALVYLAALLVQFSGRGEVIGLATAVLLTCASAVRAKWVVAVLTVKPMLFLGSVSYSIYLLHPLVIAGVHQAGLELEHPFAYFLLVYGLTVGLSFLTYLLIERPSNDLGRRVAARVAA
ncbi:MAG: exopolysaccharide production protein ExoZ [Paracoccaceae bacterium]